MIDVNAWLGRWPFRRLPLDSPEALARRLRALGVDRAWVGHLDALFHEDVAAVNARLSEQCDCHGDGLFLPFGTVNPMLPDWPEDLRRCQEVHRMPGIRLHPDFHGYLLTDPTLAELLASAQARGLVVQVALSMEDARTRHPRLELPEVDSAPLANLSSRFPTLRLMALNAGRALGAVTPDWLLNSDIPVEIATLEGAGGLNRLVDAIGAPWVMLGTNAPIFIPESAVLKLRESAPSDEVRSAVLSGNATRWLGGGRKE